LFVVTGGSAAEAATYVTKSAYATATRKLHRFAGAPYLRVITTDASLSVWRCGYHVYFSDNFWASMPGTDSINAGGWVYAVAQIEIYNTKTGASKWVSHPERSWLQGGKPAQMTWSTRLGCPAVVRVWGAPNYTAHRIGTFFSPRPTTRSILCLFALWRRYLIPRHPHEAFGEILDSQRWPPGSVMNRGLGNPFQNPTGSVTKVPLPP